MSYRIGSFNLCNFSYTSVKEEKKDIATLARIIREKEMDIVALQEVHSVNALMSDINSLIKQLGPNHWGYCWASPDTLGCPRAAEGYAYIWNKDRVKLSEYTDEEGNVIRQAKPDIFNQYKDRSRRRLLRNPYYARFQPIRLPGCEIRLINIHIMWNKSKSPEAQIQYLSNDSNERKREFEILTQALYPNIADHRYGNNRPSYTIILGDYNLNLESSGGNNPYVEPRVVVEGRNGVRTLVTIQDEMTTLKSSDQSNSSDPLSDSLSYWANNYDHFTLDEELFSKIKIRTERVDSVREFFGGDFLAHKNKVSDHVPIIIDLNLK